MSVTEQDIAELIKESGAITTAAIANRRDRNMDRLLAGASKSVMTAWGEGWFMLGGRIQRALLCEEVLRIASMQDVSVSAETVVRIVQAGRSWAMSLEGEN